MTRTELDSLIPNKSMVYAKRDDVGYTFLGIDANGKYRLCGMPFGYEDYIIMNSFYVKVDRDEI